MATLLVVQTSPRAQQSVSRHLTERFVGAWQSAHPHGRIIDRDLSDTPLTFITAPWLEAYFTPVLQQSAEMRDNLRLSNDLIDELFEADHLVIATPVYNYNVPATLKAWVDHVVRRGMTLGLDGTGLIKGKKATLLLASGSAYTKDSPHADRDIATQYLRLILDVIGITEVEVIAAGNSKGVDLGWVTMAEFLEGFEPQIMAASA